MIIRARRLRLFTTTVATALLVLGPSVAQMRFGRHIIVAQTSLLPLDLARLARVIVYHPTLLTSDEYGASYVIEIPGVQRATLFSAGRSAEFDEIAVESDQGDITEVRTSRSGEPSALVIRRGQTGLVATWDLSATDKIPPPPPEAEVRRRFELGVNLFGKTQDLLGLKDFKGGETGSIDIRLDGVENLLLDSRGAEARYTYEVTSLAKQDMVEDLRAEPSATTLSISVGSDQIVVERQEEANGRKTVARLTLEGSGWQASREVTLPGQRPIVEDLTRAEAERLLADGLHELEQARKYLGVPFGRNVSGIRLP